MCISVLRIQEVSSVSMTVQITLVDCCLRNVFFLSFQFIDSVAQLLTDHNDKQLVVSLEEQSFITTQWISFKSLTVVSTYFTYEVEIRGFRCELKCELMFHLC